MEKIIDNRVGEPDLSLIPPHLLPGKLPAELYLLSELGYSLDRRGMHRCLVAIANDFNLKNHAEITEANVVLAAGARSAATSAILRVLGKARFSARRGRLAVVKVHISRNGRRRVLRRRKLRCHASVVVRRRDGTRTTVRTTIVLVAPKAGS